MNRDFRFKLVNNPKQSVRKTVGIAWRTSLVELELWMRTRLIDAMVFGGLGINGIRDTNFYKYISSDEGLSELGINKGDPPKLLDAYKDTFKVFAQGDTVTIEFGDQVKLKLATPHPFVGTGHLQVQSWMEFATDGITVQRGFVPREKLPEPATNAIRLSSPLGGLMLPAGAFGNRGLWRFPDSLLNYEDEWFRDNVSAIQIAVLTQAVAIFSRNLK